MEVVVGRYFVFIIIIIWILEAFGGMVTRCPALCRTVMHFHYFSHVLQIEMLLRIVIDSQTPVLLELCGENGYLRGVGRAV